MAWPTRRIGDLAVQRRERVVLEDGREYRTMGVRWHGKGAYLRGIETTSSVKAKSLWQVRTGDFVFNRIDTQKGAFDVVPAHLDGALVTNEFPVYTAGPELLAEFLLVHFQRPSVLAQIDATRAGSEGRARWKQVDFESTELPLPPIEEQRRMVAAMEAVGRYLGALELELASGKVLEMTLREALMEGSVCAAGLPPRGPGQ